VPPAANMKQFGYLGSTGFKLFSQMKRNSINYCVILFIISVRGGHCDNSSRVPKTLYATGYLFTIHSNFSI
jgi:hypothetical protein